MYYDIGFTDNALFLDSRNTYINTKERSDIGNGWKLIGPDAALSRRADGIVLSHNGTHYRNKINIIHTVNLPDAVIEGQRINFDVETKVLKPTAEGLGGVVAFINAKDYNAGKLERKIAFTNSEWKRISLSFTSPSDGFKGVTIALRAEVTEGDDAIVAFRNPQLQVTDSDIDDKIIDMSNTDYEIEEVCRGFANAAYMRGEFNDKIQTLMRGYAIAEEIVRKVGRGLK